jgi:hypothetical protein
MKFIACTLKDATLEFLLNPQSHPPIKFFQQTALPTGSKCMQQQFKKILKLNIFVCSLPFHKAQITPPIFYKLNLKPANSWIVDLQIPVHIFE